MKNRIIPAALLLIIVILASFRPPQPQKVFLLGDSISLQYGVYLEKYFKGEYIIECKGSTENAMKNLDVPVDANGGDSRMVLAYLKTKASDPSFKPDLMLLNCGLHDIKRIPLTHQIAVDTVEYRNNLEAIYKLISGKKIPLIWIRTTEVVDSIHAEKSKAFDRYAKDLDQYNRIADEVFIRHNIPEIDLYNFTKLQGKDRYADHVHYIPTVVNAQAAYIAGFVKGG
jgi:hypothetical protein